MKVRIHAIAIAVWSCTSLACGDDGSAPDASVAFDGALARADAARPDAAAPDASTAGPPCYGVSAAGCCDGTTVVFCERDALQTIECAPYPCGWSDTNQLFKCNGQDPAPDAHPAACPDSLP